MIKRFLNTITTHQDDYAFIYETKHHLSFKTYQELKDDIYRFCQMIKDVDGKMLIFSPLSYETYCLVIASIYLGKEIIIIDSFKDFNKVKMMTALVKPDYLVVNNVTKHLKWLYKPFKDLKLINVSKYYLYQNQYTEPVINNQDTLYTFTSGTTSTYKVIKRNPHDLLKQLMVVESTFKEDVKVVLCLFPIYVLALILLGKTVYLPKRKDVKHLQKSSKLINLANVDTYMGSVSKLIGYQHPQLNYKYVYTGGSKINYFDALKIKDTFKNATIILTYGASEANIIATTSLDEYLQHLENNLFCAGKVCKEVEISIDSPNDEGVGEIVVKGINVLKTTHHHTGDLGKVTGDKLYLYGRLKYTNLQSYIYPYVVENKLLRTFPNLKELCYIYYNDIHYLIYDGKVDENNLRNEFPYKVTIIKSKLKKDIRHHYKVDYNEVIKIIEAKH